MSWMKRGQGSAPEQPAPPYAAPPQATINQQAMFPNYQGVGNGQQQYWNYNQQSQYPQQFSQPPQQLPPQQDYTNNANQNQYQYQQQPVQYNQHYTNQNNTQPGYQQQGNYYQNQAVQPQSFPQNKKADNWEENWGDWGWDESSKQAMNAAAAHPPQLAVQQVSQQQNFNNANVIEECFTSTDTWNWSGCDDKTNKDKKNCQEAQVDNSLPVEQPRPVEEIDTTDHSQNILAEPATEEVRTLNDREAVKERMPNLALGKRFHLENLTPQWSIESQMSQESSDGPQTHSESTYRSDNQSRNSSKSSPGLNTENTNFNYSQSGIDEFHQDSEWSRNSNEEPTVMDSLHSSSGRRESHNELTLSSQEMCTSNCENPNELNALKELESSNESDVASSLMFPPPPTNFTSAVGGSHSAIPPPPPATSSDPVPCIPPPSLPPTNFPVSSSTNPFKHAGPFSHKTVAKPSPSSSTLPQPFVPQMSSPTQHFTAGQVQSSALVSPSAVSKAQNSRTPDRFGANLETTPDNSERPDQPPVNVFRPVPIAQQIPENLEVAPQNDRNEYLQTAHLSSSDYVENTDFSRNVPPGLRRMVVGQQESEYNQNLNISGDEPPPGLSRMVPGQQNEADNTYNQSSDNYIMDRHVDGQQTDSSQRPFRQPDGQQTPDNYTQAAQSSRRPIGLDRMVPGEPSNGEYSQYPSNFPNEHRVVTGLDHDYPLPTDAGPSDIREQNLDGSDYTEQRNPSRNVPSGRDSSNDNADYPTPPEDQQREVIMEGENLQDLSVVSSTELTMSREDILDGANNDVNEVPRNNDNSDSLEHPSTNSRRQSLNRVNTSGDDSTERDRAFKSSPRRDREKGSKPSRDRENRYSREERKYDRERGERRSVREDSRRTREHSPSQGQRTRRSTRSHRYETEDTDYYSERERERRRYREGSYTSKPPRPEDKDRYYRDERERNRRHGSRRYEEERDGGTTRRHRSDKDGAYDRHYRDIDPSRKYGNLRRERDEDDRRRVVTFSDSAKSNDTDSLTKKQGGTSRAESRDPATDEELNSTLASTDSRRRHERARRRREHDSYYDGYGVVGAGTGGVGGGGGLPLTRQQYEYYAQLRATDPAAYLLLYRQLMGQQQHQATQHYADVGYVGSGYSGRGETQSGRSSAAGLKGTDTDLTTDASINLQLDESTVRSDRMTPFKYPSAHTKASISMGALVVVRAVYPGPGTPATVQLVPLQLALTSHPLYRDLPAYPGPLIKGVSHKKSVIEYCESRVGSGPSSGTGEASGTRDVIGHALIWQLLALLLRQNGVVVGSDIAELLMQNKRQYDYDTYNKQHSHTGSGRGSRSSEKPVSPPPSQPSPSPDQQHSTEESSWSQHQPQQQMSSDEALDSFRDLLLIGNKTEALEVAMSNGLWSHALLACSLGGRRARAAVHERFLQAQPRTDPLRTLYQALHHNHAVIEERSGDWRPHAAMLLANSSARPEQDRRTLTLLGDRLSSGGLVYSAQFCYMSAGVPFSRHPLSPLPPPAVPPGAPATPRLALLLSDPRCTSLSQLATNEAIFATEIYEYAMSLNQDYVVKELQVYKYLLACRLCEAGLVERALGYVELIASCVASQPSDYSHQLLTQLNYLADRLKYHDSGLQSGVGEEEGGGEGTADSTESSPRHAPWIQQLSDMTLANHTLSQQSTPQHGASSYNTVQQQQQQQQYTWDQQPPVQQTYQQPQQPTTYPEVEEPAQYYTQPAPDPPAPPVAPEPQLYQQQQQWTAEDSNQVYQQDSYSWQDQYSYVDGSAGAGAGEEESRPMITLPGTAPPAQPHLYSEYEDDAAPRNHQNEHDSDTKSKRQDAKTKDDGKDGAGGGKGGQGWLGGILTKLSLRAPNQMILPDDKNPTIVWDEQHKRWKNLEGDDTEVTNPPPPPPKMSELQPNIATSSPLQPPGPGAPPPSAAGPPTSNIFKMQKGRHIKKSYVDVFNPSGAPPSRPAPPAAALLPPAPPAPAHNYFVPAMPTQKTQSCELSIALTPVPSLLPSRPPTPDQNDVYNTREMGNDTETYHSGI